MHGTDHRSTRAAGSILRQSGWARAGLAALASLLLWTAVYWAMS